MVAAWRRLSIVARLRAEPAAALAPLNHMLKKGFFLIHGFFICDFSNLIVSCPKAQFSWTTDCNFNSIEIYGAAN
jgi:hypothetical protein